MKANDPICVACASAGSRGRMMTLRSVTWVFSGFFTALVTLTGCSPRAEEDPRSAAQRPDVLLVTFDTTRADHLGPYGCSYAFTPTLDRLARESIKFDRAFSCAPITLPSHTSIMTGLYPFYHGVRDNSHFVVKPEINTLAESLSEAGYQTGATIAAFVLDAQFGLDQGFDHYDDHVETKAVQTPFAVPERIAEHVTTAAIEWLESIDRSKPYFLWVHYYDPHAGYRPPATFTRYQGNPYDVEIAYADSELGRLLRFVDDTSSVDRRPMIVFTADHGDALGQYGEKTHAYFAYDSTLHVPLIVHLPDGKHAGGEIDTVVGIVDIMPTILDVVGLEVPPPDTMHGRSLTPLWNSPQPPPELVDRAIAFESYEAHYGYGWAPVRGVRVGEVKFFEVPKPELYLLAENPREVPEANVNADRPELVAAMREQFRFLWDGALSIPSFAAQPQAPDEDTMAKLRALGYAAAPLPSNLDEESGADVKDKLAFYNKSLESMALIGNGEIELAMESLLSLYREDPKCGRVLSILAHLGNTVPEAADRVLPLLRERLSAGDVSPDQMSPLLLSCAQMAAFQGDTAGAMKYCSDAIAIQPDSGMANWALGIMLLRAGRGTEAVEPLKRAVDIFGPRAYSRHAIYGLALLTADKPQEGFAVWKGIIHADPNGELLWAPASLCSFDVELARVALPHLQRAKVEGAPDATMLAALELAESDCLRLQGRYDEALRMLESVRSRLAEDDAEYMTAKAILLRALGRLDEAKALLSDVCERNPRDTNAVRAYAAILESTGECDRGVEVLQRLYEARPTDPMIMNDLAWMLGCQGKDVRRGIVLATQASECLPGSPILVDTLGWLHHLDGRDQSAVRLLTKARKLLPNSADTAYRLAVVLKAVGRDEDARGNFAAAIELAGNARPAWYAEAEAGAALQP